MSHTHALVGTNKVVKINAIDDDDIEATDTSTNQTESYSIKHSGLQPLTESEVNAILERHIR